MIEIIKDRMKGLLTLVIIGLAIWFVINTIKDIKYDLTPKDWTLDVYSSDTPNKDYLQITIPGYKAQTSCMEKGYSYTKTKGSFECSYGCGKTKDYGNMEDVCVKVCDKFSCR